MCYYESQGTFKSIKYFIINKFEEVCECRPGFIGKFCENQVPVCDSQPCFNGGICENSAGTFRCTCPLSK